MAARDIQGFNKKSLTEEINDVMKGTGTRTEKRHKLIKIGLHEGDIAYIFSQFSARTKRGAFCFSKLTFGVEIECYNVSRGSLINRGEQKGLSVRSERYNHVDNNHYYKIVQDGSVQGEDANEIVSPILGGKKGLDSLKKMCETLNELDAKVNRSCGLHVHIGAEVMSDEHYIRVIRNYQKLEAAIDTFMPQSRRGNNNMYCGTLQGFDFTACRNKRDAYSIMNGRYYKVNTEAYWSHKTLEFRQHAGTTDYEKISNWIAFLAQLVEYSYKNELASNVYAIEDIPFLADKQKEFYTNRRALLS